MPKKFEGFVPPQEHEEEKVYLQNALGEKYEVFTPATKELLYEIAGIESKDKFRAERTARFFLEIDHCIDGFTFEKSFREFLLSEKSQAAGRGFDSSAKLAKELIEKQFIKLKNDKEKVDEIYNKSLRDKVGSTYERFTPMVKELLEEMGGEEWRGEKWQHDSSWKRAKDNAEKAKWKTWEKEARPYIIARFAEKIFNSVDHYTLEKITLGEELLSDEEKNLAKREELTTDRMVEVTAKLAEKFLENQFLK